MPAPSTHTSTLPWALPLALLQEEVRGSDKLKEFSQHLMDPYEPSSDCMDGPGQITALEEENRRLKAQLGQQQQ